MPKITVDVNDAEYALWNKMRKELPLGTWIKLVVNQSLVVGDVMSQTFQAMLVEEARKRGAVRLPDS